MPNYRRIWVPGGTYFFTVNLLERKRRLLVEHIDALRAAFRAVHAARPFELLGIVVLPEHLHAIWRLPEGDVDYATRWRQIKSGFSRRLVIGERRSTVRVAKGERGIWQRRYWAHLIVDGADLRHHLDYLHFNPVKHGHVRRVRDWPYSSFHREVELGNYSMDWRVKVSGLAVAGRDPPYAMPGSGPLNARAGCI
jgi:putative transposase